MAKNTLDISSMLNEMTEAAQETKKVIESLEAEKKEKIAELTAKYDEKIKAAQEKQKEKTKALQKQIKNYQKQLEKAAELLNIEPKAKKSKGSKGDLLPMGTPDELIKCLKQILKEEGALKSGQIQERLWGSVCSATRGRFNKISKEFEGAGIVKGDKGVYTLG